MAEAFSSTPTVRDAQRRSLKLRTACLQSPLIHGPLCPRNPRACAAIHRGDVDGAHEVRNVVVVEFHTKARIDSSSYRCVGAGNYNFHETIRMPPPVPKPPPSPSSPPPPPLLSPSKPPQPPPPPPPHFPSPLPPPSPRSPSPSSPPPPHKLTISAHLSEAESVSADKGVTDEELTDESAGGAVAQLGGGVLLVFLLAFLVVYVLTVCRGRRVERGDGDVVPRAMPGGSIACRSMACRNEAKAKAGRPQKLPITSPTEEDLD